MTSVTFRDSAALFRLLQQDIFTNAYAIISIDGWAGSGKSNLGRAMADALRATCLHVDGYLKPNQGKYLGALNYEALAQRLDSAVRPGVVIAEGVCVQQVLEKLGIEPTHRVYVKLVSPRGDWSEGTRLARSADELAAEEDTLREMRAMLGESDIQDAVPAMEQELRRYHHAYLPHLTADYLYERIDAG